MKPTLEEYKDARTKLDGDDFTVDGFPTVRGINFELEAGGFEEITSEERDAFEKEIANSDTGQEDAPENPEEGGNGSNDSGDMEDAPAVTTKNITLLDASCDPVHIYVHGVGSLSIRIGETKDMPIDTIEALNNSGAKFQINEPDGEND